MSDLQQTRKDPKLLASAVLVGLIIIACIVLIGIRAFSDDGSKPTGAKNTSATTAPSSSSVCGLPDGDQTVPASAPNATWELSGGKVAAPRNAAFGPGNPDTAPRTCFSHNPTGAVFAAANYLADTENPAVAPKDLVAQRVFNDENKRLAEKAATSGGANNNPTSQIAAFRVDDATPSRVSVSVVVRFTDGPDTGALAAITVTLGWQDGDWKVVVPPRGIPPTAVVSTISGYTPWSGA